MEEKKIYTDKIKKGQYSERGSFYMKKNDIFSEDYYDMG